MDWICLRVLLCYTCRFAGSKTNSEASGVSLAARLPRKVQAEHVQLSVHPGHVFQHLTSTAKQTQ